jgi:hypothetical protein
MKTLFRTETFNSPPQLVFKMIDDLGVTGSHMTESSGMMMGTKLNLEYLSKVHNGPGTKYRWTGKMMGFKMDFTVEVSKWIAGQEKVWETVGEPKLVIYSWYRMALKVTPIESATNAELSISYKQPKGLLNRIISFLFADLYCRWCLKRMLTDAKKALTNYQGARSILSSSY